MGKICIFRSRRETLHPPRTPVSDCKNSRFAKHSCLTHGVYAEFRPVRAARGSRFLRKPAPLRARRLRRPARRAQRLDEGFVLVWRRGSAPAPCRGHVTRPEPRIGLQKQPLCETLMFDAWRLCRISPRSGCARLALPAEARAPAGAAAPPPRSPRSAVERSFALALTRPRTAHDTSYSMRRALREARHDAHAQQCVRR